MKNIVRFTFLAILAFSSLSWPCQAQIIETEQKMIASDGASFDAFGQSVAISGDYFIVGASGDGDNGDSSGAAYIFDYDGTSWVEMQKLIASDGASSDKFGQSVSISGDSAIIGAVGDDDKGNESGSAYVFYYDGTSWAQEQKLTASDGLNHDMFGQSVAISGNYAIVGASKKGKRSGSAYIFFYDGTSWVEEQKLVASDGASGDKFGESVAISGNYAIVGAVGDDDNGDESGSVYVFYYDGTNWTQMQKLVASDGASFDAFGQSVSISGDSAIVGARGDDDKGNESGSAYIFFYDGTSWVQEQKVTADDGASLDAFGQSVSISGDFAIAGADKGGSPGSAYIFSYDGTSWVQEQKVIAGDGTNFDAFGQSVAISGNNTIIGAYGDDDNGEKSGSVAAATTAPVCVLEGDANGDEFVNMSDILFVRDRIGESGGPGDANGDGFVNMSDILFVRDRIGNSCL